MPKLRADRRCDPEQSDGAEEIRERNGIWVVTINGVWRGDYIKREHAVAAVQAAQHDARRAPR
jgi:hypothetical protein